MFHGQEFRNFAIDELGEEVREYSSAALLTLLEQKAKRECWSPNRRAYPEYGSLPNALPPPEESR